MEIEKFMKKVDKAEDAFDLFCLLKGAMFRLEGADWFDDIPIAKFEFVYYGDKDEEWDNYEVYMHCFLNDQIIPAYFQAKGYKEEDIDHIYNEFYRYCYNEMWEELGMYFQMKPHICIAKKEEDFELLNNELLGMSLEEYYKKTDEFEKLEW